MVGGSRSEARISFVIIVHISFHDKKLTSITTANIRHMGEEIGKKSVRSFSIKFAGFIFFPLKEIVVVTIMHPFFSLNVEIDNN